MAADDTRLREKALPDGAPTVPLADYEFIWKPFVCPAGQVQPAAPSEPAG